MTRGGQTVAVLFARSDSIYKSFRCCDVYDVERDARSYGGGMPVVAHPPCRLWGRLRKFSKAPESERELAVWAVAQVRRWGGVLEHPAFSTLWPACELPRPGAGVDAFGGWTLAVDQFLFGHRAQKATWLYFCGIGPRAVPPVQLRLDEPTHVVETRMRKGAPGYRPEISKREREATPQPFARWLCDLAAQCRPA